MKLRVCHMPQIPCDPFIVDVEDLKQAKFLADTIADYDIFQYEKRFKPDYNSTTFIEMWDEEEEEWVSWADQKTGIDDIDEYFDRLNQEK